MVAVETGVGGVGREIGPLRRERLAWRGGGGDRLLGRSGELLLLLLMRSLFLLNLSFGIEKVLVSCAS